MAHTMCTNRRSPGARHSSASNGVPPRFLRRGTSQQIRQTADSQGCIPAATYSHRAGLRSPAPTARQPASFPNPAPCAMPFLTSLGLQRQPEVHPCPRLSCILPLALAPSLPSPPSPHSLPTPFSRPLALFLPSRPLALSPSCPLALSPSCPLALAFALARDLTFTPTYNQLHLTTARGSSAASSQQSAELLPPLPSKWGLPEPQDFAAYRVAPRSAGYGGSPMLAPVALRAGAHELHGAGSMAALLHGARCGGCGGSSFKDRFTGGSHGGSFGDSFAGSGGFDAPQTRSHTKATSAGLRHLGCSPNPFASPAPDAPLDAAFPPPGCGAFEGFERTCSDFDFDTAFSGVLS